MILYEEMRVLCEEMGILCEGIGVLNEWDFGDGVRVHLEFSFPCHFTLFVK